MSGPLPTDAVIDPAAAPRMRGGRAAAARAAGWGWGLLLVAPALAMVVLFFLYPLGFSAVSAFRSREGEWTLANFAKAFELYHLDMLFTLAIVLLSTLLVALLAVAIGGYLTLGENRTAVAVLRWLYRWPLFIPFIVASQMMRSVLAKNGLMNNALIGSGIIEPLQAASLLDWRGVVVTFVWKQTPFVALMVAGAMASLDRSTIEAARDLGAGRLRILAEIVVPQVRPTLVVGLILSFVTMLSVMSVPMMINPNSPTMITVDMAYRINAHGDYGVANALGFVSYAMAGLVGWIYLRHGVRQGGAR
ncbi:ABC transporter permease (plasmid) [Azospirillum thermophilum]|uniref:ABC transporter permease n=2 Tax=Azospirillum thermophilum TaxID=2202148 RepID=A0A2S2CW08_9PROT|nr:ABC transporter permease [Azospirillum thermophilum]